MELVGSLFSCRPRQTSCDCKDVVSFLSHGDGVIRRAWMELAARCLSRLTFLEIGIGGVILCDNYFQEALMISSSFANNHGEGE